MATRSAMVVRDLEKAVPEMQWRFDVTFEECRAAYNSHTDFRNLYRGLIKTCRPNNKGRIATSGERGDELIIPRNRPMRFRITVAAASCLTVWRVTKKASPCALRSSGCRLRRANGSGLRVQVVDGDQVESVRPSLVHEPEARGRGEGSEDRLCARPYLSPPFLLPRPLLLAPSTLLATHL